MGELGRLPRRDHPADHVAAEDVEDHVEVKAHPLGRPLELGDIPGPQLARAAGEQLGLGVGGVGELIAPPAGLARGAQQPVEGGHRGEVATRIEQQGEHGVGAEIRVRRGVQPLEDRVLFRYAQCPGRGCMRDIGLLAPTPDAARGRTSHGPPRALRRRPQCRSAGRTPWRCSSQGLLAHGQPQQFAQFFGPL